LAGFGVRGQIATAMIAWQEEKVLSQLRENPVKAAFLTARQSWMTWWHRHC
jgi:hypothetical protein